MKIVVDTSVWSLALRRRNFTPSPYSKLLSEIVQDGRTVLLGVVRQELLSGIKDQNQYERLREKLRAFPDETVEMEDYEVAASYFNKCMSKGIQGSAMDFLICSFASRRNYQVLTTDPDFKHYSRHLPLSLLNP